MRIAILEAQTYGEDVSLEAFSKYGEVDTYTLVPTDPIENRLKDIDVIVTNKFPVNKETLSNSVKLVLQTGTGFNNINLEDCRQLHVAVCNVAGYSTISVAQHTFALALSLFEHLEEYDEMVKDYTYSNSGIFSIFSPSFYELNGKTWGIIGLGSIGKEVARLATAFGCKVIYYSTTGKNKDSNYQQVDFDTILKTSDILSIHAALTDENVHLINKESLSKMKKTSILINVARGPFVDEKALQEALDEDLIAGAGLDVMEKEPLPLESPLLKIKNKHKILITPHMGWGSVEARTRLIEEVILNLEAYNKGERRNRID